MKTIPPLKPRRVFLIANGDLRLSANQKCWPAQQEMEAISLKPADMPVLSNVTALPHGSPGEILERLVEQVTGSVRWEDSMRYLIGQGFEQFIELGPGTALSGFLKRIDKTVSVLNVADIPSLQATVAALS